MADQQAKVVFQAIPAYKSRAETMALAAPPEIDFVVVDANLPEEEQIRQCAGAAALIITPNTFSLNILRGCPSVKLVQTISAGYDRIDVKAAGEMGVLVANNGGANAISVAEHALTLMMSVGRHTMNHWHNTVKGRQVASEHGRSDNRAHRKDRGHSRTGTHRQASRQASYGLRHRHRLL